jgi:hypothetical protein
MRQEVVGWRDQSDWVDFDVEPTVSSELFQRAQGILSQNKREQNGRPATQHKYLLKGLLVCACGRHMHGGYSDKTNDYRCSKDSETTIDAEKCPHPRLPQRETDELVWERIRGLILEPQELVMGYEKTQREQEHKNAILLEQAEGLRTEIHQAKVKLDNLLDLLLAEDIDKETYRRKKGEIERGITDAKLELTKVEAELQAEKFTDGDKEQLLAFCKRIAQNLEAATFEDKRRLLLMLGVSVKHRPDENLLVVSGAFPTEEVSISQNNCAHPPPLPPMPA